MAKKRARRTSQSSGRKPKGKPTKKTSGKPPKNLILRGVEQETWQSFEAVASVRNMPSVNKLMVLLLNQFTSASAIASTLDESPKDELRQLTEVLEQMAWADHAFSARHWNWSLSRLTKVLEVANERNLIGLSQIARYRLSFVLLELATRLELRAIQQNAANKFGAAKRALCFAIAIHEEFLSHEQEAVLIFNDACANALIARVLVHEWPAARTERLIEEVKDLTSTDAVGQAYKAAWINSTSHIKGNRQTAELREANRGIGFLWRKSMHPRRVELIESFGLKATERLEELTKRQTQSTEPPASFWIELAERDSDLLFLHCDSEFPRDIKSWANRYHGAADPDLESLAALPTCFPDQIVHSANEIFRDLETESALPE